MFQFEQPIYFFSRSSGFRFHSVSRLGARHSGILGAEGGFFKMVSVGQVDKFVGSEANGITTADYGAYSGVRYVQAFERDGVDLPLFVSEV
jgi:hypothetical protein